MDEIRGVITKVTTDKGTNRRGAPYVRWVFTINDKNYSTFDEKIGAFFKVEDKVVMTGYQRGDFWNMKSMRIDDGSVKPEQAFDVPKEVKVSLDNRNATMYVSYVKDLIVSGMNPVDAIKTIKEIREEFTNGNE